jgi:hypothetical protein
VSVVPEWRALNMVDNLGSRARERLIAEVSKPRDLCWHHTDPRSLLSERIHPAIARPKFLRGCTHYRQPLDVQARGTPILDQDYDG